MAILESGKLFIPESPQQILDYMLNDVRLEAAKYGATEPAIQPGTDDYLFFTAAANATYLQYGNIATLRSSFTPINATGQDLLDWRDSLGLSPGEPGPSSGKVRVKINGTATIEDGREILLPNRLRIKVVGNHVGITTGAEVDVIAIDSGTATNAKGGTKVEFFDPPLNVLSTAEVSNSSPLVGGTDEENEARLRDRILNTMQDTPSGGNWGNLRKLAFEALPSVQGAFVYPAIGGPSSCKVVIVKDIDPDNDDFTRYMNDTALEVVRQKIHREIGSESQHVIATATHEPTDVALEVVLPASALAGGSGTGWTDALVWPDILVADSGRVLVDLVSSTTQIRVTAATTTSPIAGITHIAWWSSSVQSFYTALVTGVSGGTGAWVLSLDQPLVDRLGNSVAAGDFISPASASIKRYGDSWRDVMRQLTPGENTTDGNRLPRAARHPKEADGYPARLDERILAIFAQANPEMTRVAYNHTSLVAPTIPALTTTTPNVLVPRHFGLYKYV